MYHATNFITSYVSLIDILQSFMKYRAVTDYTLARPECVWIFIELNIAKDWERLDPIMWCVIESDFSIYVGEEDWCIPGKINLKLEFNFINAAG